MHGAGGTGPIQGQTYEGHVRAATLYSSVLPHDISFRPAAKLPEDMRTAGWGIHAMVTESGGDCSLGYVVGSRLCKESQ